MTYLVSELRDCTLRQIGRRTIVKRRVPSHMGESLVHAREWAVADSIITEHAPNRAWTYYIASRLPTKAVCPI